MQTGPTGSGQVRICQVRLDQYLTLWGPVDLCPPLSTSVPPISKNFVNLSLPSLSMLVQSTLVPHPNIFLSSILVHSVLGIVKPLRNDGRKLFNFKNNNLSGTKEQKPKSCYLYIRLSQFHQHFNSTFLYKSYKHNFWAK